MLSYTYYPDRRTLKIQIVFCDTSRSLSQKNNSITSRYSFPFGYEGSAHFLPCLLQVNLPPVGCQQRQGRVSFHCDVIFVMNVARSQAL